MPDFIEPGLLVPIVIIVVLVIVFSAQATARLRRIRRSS